MSKRFDIGKAEFRLGEVKPLQMIDGCGWSVGGNGYAGAGCGGSGWLDPDDYDDFRFCPFCGEKIHVIRVDEEEDE